MTADKPSLLRRLGFPALRILGILVVAMIVLLLFEKKIIFVPTSRLDVEPKGLGLDFEELSLKASDGVRLHGYYLPARDSRLSVLFCHGNGGNISHRLDRVLVARSKMPLDFLLFDYRGYGRSEGSPDEQGTYRDARAAWEYLAKTKQIPPNRIVIWGESVGCAVALELAVAVPARALVLESPFESMSAMARAKLPFLPLGPFIRTRYDNMARIPSLRMPLLVLHGTEDEVIPFAQGLRLFEAAPHPKTFYAIESAGHNDTYAIGGDAYWNAITAFLTPLAAPPSAAP